MIFKKINSEEEEEEKSCGKSDQLLTELTVPFLKNHDYRPMLFQYNIISIPGTMYSNCNNNCQLFWIRIKTNDHAIG